MIKLLFTRVSSGHLKDLVWLGCISMTSIPERESVESQKN